MQVVACLVLLSLIMLNIQAVETYPLWSQLVLSGSKSYSYFCGFKVISRTKTSFILLHLKVSGSSQPSRFQELVCYLNWDGSTYAPACRDVIQMFFIFSQKRVLRCASWDIVKCFILRTVDRRNPAPLWMVETCWNPINNGMFTTVFNWCRISQPSTVCNCYLAQTRLVNESGMIYIALLGRPIKNHRMFDLLEIPTWKQPFSTLVQFQ